MLQRQSHRYSFTTGTRRDGRAGGRAHGPRIVSIAIEVHFWVTLRMEQPEDVMRVRYAGLYLQQHRFQTLRFKAHKGIILPYQGELAFVHPDLVAGGLDREVCCFMYEWMREELLDCYDDDAPADCGAASRLHAWPTMSGPMGKLAREW